MSLKYLRDAFALLEQSPRPVTEARARMKAQEAKYGFRFPPAVAEWFAHGGKERLSWLMARHRDGLRVLAWNRLGAPLKVKYQGRRYAPADEKMLVLIASDEWGYWAVRLEGDDPPLYWGGDIPGPGAADHKWVPVTERFSGASSQAARAGARRREPVNLGSGTVRLLLSDLETVSKRCLEP